LSIRNILESTLVKTYSQISEDDPIYKEAYKEAEKRMGERGKKRPDRLKMLAKGLAQNGKREQFLKKHKNKAFKATIQNWRPAFVIVAKSSKPAFKGQWQASFFDEKGPWGDITNTNYAELIKEIDISNKIDYSKIKFMK